MTQRLRQPPLPDPRRAGRRRGVWGARTIPAETARDVAAERAPTLLGFPAEFADAGDTDEVPAEETGPRALPPSSEVVVLRRAERFGGGALVLAGVAANVSLSVSWLPGEGPPGLSLVRHGIEVLGAGVVTPLAAWQPLVVVLSGGLFVLLGVLLLVPARAHRLLGLLALVVSLAAGAAVVVLSAEGGWEPDRFGPGMWCAAAVPLLGLTGSLKAMLTAPQVTIGPR